LSASAAIVLRFGSSAREALRDATAETHLRMHGLAPFTAIAEERLTRTRYARLLQALFVFHSAVAVAAQRSGWSSVSSSTEKLDLIASDLSRLSAFAPDWISDWRPGCPESVLGAIYVAEGSMMGGKLIARQLDYLLGARDEGRRFFIGRGHADSLTWRQLLAVLECKLADPRALDSATAGALAAFDLFETCVARVMPRS
jgi:heme oxygenase